eukprot:14311658-Alexandrium_andersonii.AAC.1
MVHAQLSKLSASSASGASSATIWRIVWAVSTVSKSSKARLQLTPDTASSNAFARANIARHRTLG